MGEIEPGVRSDVEFAVLHNRSVPDFMAQAIVKATAGKFASTHIIRSRRFGVGWPEGCNDLWQDGMRQIARLHDTKRITAPCVLTFEPDCCILRPDWINALIAEWEAVHNEEKHCFGHVNDAGGNRGIHINGNAVFLINMVIRYAKMQSSAVAWDIEHKDITMSVGRDSNTIIQLYGRKDPVTRDEIEAIRKNGEIPAFVHGIKHPSGNEIIREMIKDGSFAERGAK